MKTNYTHLILIIDRSGSMGNIAKDMNGGMASFIKEQQKVPGDCTISAYQFNNSLENLCSFKNIFDMKDKDMPVITPTGGTALNDAIGDVFITEGRKLAAMSEFERPGRVMVTIVTDSEENSSSKYNTAQIKNMIEHQRTVYNWQIDFMGCNEEAMAVKDAYQINAAFSSSGDIAKDWSKISKLKGSMRSMSPATYNATVQADKNLYDVQ